MERLTEQFARLPGIGGKSAQRLAFHVLNLPMEEAEAFAQQQRDAAKAQADKILSDAKDAAESERQKIVAEANREAVAIAEDAMEKLMAAQTAQAYDAFVNAAKEEQNEH